MSTPFPPKFCSAEVAFELIGQLLFSDNWTGNEAEARRLPVPEAAREAKAIAKCPARNELSDFDQL